MSCPSCFAPNLPLSRAALSTPHLTRLRPISRRPRHIVRAIASNGDGDAGASSDARPTATEARSGRENDLLTRLDGIEEPSDPSAAENEARAKRFLGRQTQLIWLSTRLFGEVSSDVSEYFEPPVRRMVAGSLAILFGFFSATSANTIIGSVADWDPLAAAVLLVWTEVFTKFYYSVSEKTLVLKLANAFKIGLIYGMAVDAFKLST